MILYTMRIYCYIYYPTLIGLAPNILRGMSMNVGMMSCYDQALEQIMTHVTHDKDHKKPSLPAKLMASGVAGFTAASFSLPFDMIKSRLQNGGGNYTGHHELYILYHTLYTLSYTIYFIVYYILYTITGVISCATSILRQEGVFAFWTGFSAYYGRW